MVGAENTRRSRIRRRRRQRIEMQQNGNSTTVENSVEASSWRTLSGSLVLLERSMRRHAGSNGRATHPTVVRDEDPVVGLVSVAGRRREMEDAVKVRLRLCHPAINGYRPVDFFGLYDGHGGSHFSTMCKERMHEILGEELMRVRTNGTPLSNGASNSRPLAHVEDEGFLWQTWRRVLTNTYISSEMAALTTCVCEHNGLNFSCNQTNIFYSGSTAVVVVLTDHHIVVANCGDSRAILSRAGRVVPLSFDHKPEREDEKRRIESLGGHVLVMDTPRVEGILAMSRAIGDSFLKPLVMSEPEITFTRRDEEDEFIILASDGLWDVMSNEMACHVTRQCLREPGTREHPSKSTLAANLLTHLALARDSGDNISVVVVDLKGHA